MKRHFYSAETILLQRLKMLHPVVTQICSGQNQIAKLAVFSKFRTHDLEVLSPNYEKALLLSIGNIAAKFEDATPCSYRDMLRTKKWDARCPPTRPPPQAITITQAPGGCGLKSDILNFQFSFYNDYYALISNFKHIVIV